MSTEANVIPESSFESQAAATAEISWLRRFYWSVRRELWESRWIYIAPLAVAALTLIGFLIRTMHLAGMIHAGLINTQMKNELIDQPYDFAAALLMFTTLIVGIFYCLEALYSERRDRSILFWKSLPVSDATTVLSKAFIPLIILPLLTFAITVTTQFLMLLLSSAVLAAFGLNVAILWTNLQLFQMSMLLLYHLFTVHSLWWAPYFGWLLLISAWARRAPFLWAILPLLAIGVVERIAFNTSHFAAMMQTRLNGSSEAITPPGGLPIDPMTHLTPTAFLTSRSLWIGLAVAAAFLFTAVRLRRHQGPV